jgi:mycothiol synthase
MTPTDLRAAPLPDIATHGIADPADYARLADLIDTANAHDRIPYLPSGTDLQVDFEASEGVDPARDVILVEADGRLIAATGVDRVIREDIPVYDIWGAVDPGFRRRGLGGWLHRWTIDRVADRAAVEDPTGQVELGTFAEEGEAGHRALLDASGFRQVRHFFLMRRTDLDDVPDAPMPDGLEIRPVTIDQRRTIFDAENEAFRDHWGHREMGDADYAKTYSRDGLDTDLWVVAWDGDQVAGVVQNWIWPEENARLGVNRGWLEHISVRRPWRRRGLGRAITALSLRRLREVGLDEAMLGVDSENANGALGLYEGLGFTVYSRAAAYRRSLER